jgi:hypothetical protein
MMYLIRCACGCCRCFVCCRRQQLQQAQAAGQVLPDDVREMLSMSHLQLANVWLSTTNDETGIQRMQRVCEAARKHRIISGTTQHAQIDRAFPEVWQRVLYAWAPTAPVELQADLQWCLDELDRTEAWQRKLSIACAPKCSERSEGQPRVHLEHRLLTLQRSHKDQPLLSDTGSTDLDWTRKSAQFWSGVQDNESQSSAGQHTARMRQLRERVSAWMLGSPLRATATATFFFFSFTFTIYAVVRIRASDDKHQLGVLAACQHMAQSRPKWVVLLTVYWLLVTLCLAALLLYARWQSAGRCPSLGRPSLLNGGLSDQAMDEIFAAQDEAIAASFAAPKRLQRDAMPSREPENAPSQL